MEALFKQGTRVMYHGAMAVVTPLPTRDLVLTFPQLQQAEPIVLGFDQAMDEFGSSLHLVNSEREASKVQLSLSPAEKFEIARRRAYVDELIRSSDRGGPGGTELRTQVIARVKKRLNDDKGMSPASLARYLEQHRNHSHGLAASVVKKPKQKRRSPLSQQVRDQALLAFTRYYLTRPRKTIQQVYDLFIDDLDANDWPQDDRPCRATFFNWSKELSQLSLIEAHQGPNARHVAERNAVSEIIVDRILERVEVDAVHLAVGIVDDEGRYLGTVTVYVAVDCYSRSILGVQVQLGRGESAASVIDCYKHAFMPKARDSYSSEAINAWIQFGMGETIVSDGGVGYKAVQTISFLMNAGCHAEIVQTATGWHKPYVESFFVTLRSTFANTLPGYCGHLNDQRKIDDSVQDLACMTLQQFKDALTHWIVDEYHQAPHSGLGGKSPQEAWAQQARLFPPQAPINADRIEYSKGEELSRTISGQHGQQGVVINNVRYNDSEGRLKQLYFTLRAMGESPLVVCHYSPNDISCISIVDPCTHESFVAFATDSNITVGSTLAEYQAAHPSLYKRKGYGRARVSENSNVIASAKRALEDKRRNRPSTSPQFVDETEIMAEMDRQTSAGRSEKDATPKKPKVSRTRKALRDSAADDREGYDYV